MRKALKALGWDTSIVSKNGKVKWKKKNSLKTEKNSDYEQLVS